MRLFGRGGWIRTSEKPDSKSGGLSLLPTPLFIMRALSLITLQTILAGEEGIEPSHAGFRVQCLNLLATPLYFNCSFIQLAGVEGFEPSHGGIKIRCLTAWRHP